MTRTKIVCTMGPATSSYETMLALIDAGMNVARLNFSHGTQEEHLETIKKLKKARKEKGVPLAIMLDLQGPKIRVDPLPNGPITLKAGQTLSIPGDISIHPSEVMAAFEVGSKVLFDDGYIVSEVVEKTSKKVTLKIINPGVLKSNKGVNIPGAKIPLPALTEKDIDDLRFGCKVGVDLIAASFIRSAHHMLQVKEILKEEGREDLLVIAKIESTQGIENFDSIVQVADGIMVARGDLGVEVDLALVPKLQKMMIRKSCQACKPVVTATQMLESMITNPRPTRAEVSDVANAIYDATSCVMLSGETAVGKYPVETVERMKSIVKEAEGDFNYYQFFDFFSERDYHDISSAVSLAAVKTAYSSNAKAIFVFTTSGQTARRISRLRPKVPIIAVTDSPLVYNQLALEWGVVPVLIEKCKTVKEAFAAASRFALDREMIAFGDVVIASSGIPFGEKGSTNMIVVENIGEILLRGHKGFGPKVSGKVLFVLAPERCEAKKIQGRVVVISHCDERFVPLLKGAAAVILQNSVGDTASEKYASLLAKTFEMSVITRADGALSILNEGDTVTLDPHRGLIYRGE